MNNDVIELIFNKLSWRDQIAYSHLINYKRSQFEIALMKLQSIDFNPYIYKSSIYQHAMKTGDTDLCTEAIFRMYLEILDCESLDHDTARKHIHKDLKKRDKEYRIALVSRTFKRLQTWD